MASEVLLSSGLHVLSVGGSCRHAPPCLVCCLSDILFRMFTCMPGAWECLKRVLDVLKLEVWAAVSHFDTAAEDQTQVLCKIKCS